MALSADRPAWGAQGRESRPSARPTWSQTWGCGTEWADDGSVRRRVAIRGPRTCRGPTSRPGPHKRPPATARPTPTNPGSPAVDLGLVLERPDRADLPHRFGALLNVLEHRVPVLRHGRGGWWVGGGPGKNIRLSPATWPRPSPRWPPARHNAGLPPTAALAPRPPSTPTSRHPTAPDRVCLGPVARPGGAIARLRVRQGDGPPPVG